MAAISPGDTVDPLSALPTAELLLEPLFYLIVEEVREVRGVVGRAEGMLFYALLGGDPDGVYPMPLSGAISALNTGEWTMTLDIEQAEWWAWSFKDNHRKGAA
jgi:hypothetical protein